MELNDKELMKYEIIEMVVLGKKTRKEASFELNLSLKQIDRLKKVYITCGKVGFIHKNRGKNNPNKKDRKLIEGLEELYLNEYYDYNFEQFFEEIEEKYNISYSVMLNEFKKDDIISPLAHKETLKLYNEKMKKAIHNNIENIPEEKLDLFKTRQIAFDQAHIRRSSNMFVFGQEVQMDACEKIWFGGIVSYLHLAVDKATKKVLFGWFEYEEITRGYFVLLYNTIVNYGIPARIKTDNRNSFSNRNNKVNNTQFGIVCNMLGIELVTSSVSTAKANVERQNKTFKDRLIAEFRHENITDIDTANRYLNEVFIPKMNKKFSYEIDPRTSKMKTNNYSQDELGLIISEKYNRIVDNASTIKYNSKYYIPVNPNTGEVTCFLKKTQCTFIITYHGDYWCNIEGNYYQMIEIENRDTVMIKENDNNDKDKIKENKQYIPPKSHPWRKNMMMR